MKQLPRVLAALVALLVLAPLLGLLGGLWDPPPDPFGMPTPTLAALMRRTGAVELLASSLLLAVGTACGAGLLGGAIAWAEQRLAYPGRAPLALLSLLPLATPSYLVAATVASALGPGGPIGGPLGLPRVTGLPMAVLVLSVVCAPYVQLLVGAALARSSAAEEEAARSMGAGPWRVFRVVVLPRLRPALALSAFISLLYAISDFGAVAVLDAPVLTWRLYGAVKAQQLPEATLLGLAVLAVTVPLFVLVRWLHGSARARTVPNPRAPALRRPGPVGLGLVLLAHAIVIGLGVVLPVATMGGWVASGLSRGLPFAAPWSPLLDTVWVAALGAVLTLLLAAAPAWVAARDRPRLAWLVEQATLLTSALPGVMLALGLVLGALGLSRALPLGAADGRAAYALLSGSGALLFAGYAVRFLAEGFAPLKTAVLLLDPRQEESARALGAPRGRWLLRVGLPAVSPGAGAALLLLFVAVLKELPVTLLLGGAAGVDTLAFRVWDRYNEALWHDAGLAGLLLVVLALGGVLGTLPWRRRV